MTLRTFEEEQRVSLLAEKSRGKSEGTHTTWWWWRLRGARALSASARRLRDWRAHLGGANGWEKQSPIFREMRGRGEQGRREERRGRFVGVVRWREEL